jgi:predicted RNase H-like HicB family nuclease
VRNGVDREVGPGYVVLVLRWGGATGSEAAVIFHVTLDRAEDGWIVAECPALPGCVSQGRDEENALENIREAITAWLWAEDQKAAAKLSETPGRDEIVVAV